MSNFTPLVKKEYEFGGDKIHVSFARYKRRDMLNLMPYISAASKAEAKKDKEGVSKATVDTLNLTLGLLPEYVKSFEGLKDKEGNDVTIETVSEEMYFMDLASEIAMDILNESVVLDGKTAKKL